MNNLRMRECLETLDCSNLDTLIADRGRVREERLDDSAEMIVKRAYSNTGDGGEFLR